MEITMYEDGSFNNLARERESLAQMKRKFTLDLNGRSSKKIRAHGQPNFNSLLTSPDLNMLKLGSPELEQLVMQHGGMLPSGFNFPTPTTKATTPPSQEEFVKGFQETLDQLHQKEITVEPSAVVVSSSSSSSSLTIPIPVTTQPQYTQLEVPHPNPQHQVPITMCNTNTNSSSSFSDDSIPYIKEEPQTVPNFCGTPPHSPIDMENQERIKLERKRLRNRIAASKCRKRKLEKINRLEDKVTCLKNENSELQSIVNRMKDEVCSLKQEVMTHVHSGCQIPFVNQ